MAAALETFRLSSLPACLIFTRKSQFFLTNGLIPLPSLPSTIAVFLSKAISSRNFSPSMSIPYIQNPFFFKTSSAWFMLTTSMMSIISTAPLEVLNTVSLIGAVLLVGTMMPATPNTSQLLIIAPKLCGSSISSNTAIVMPVSLCVHKNSSRVTVFTSSMIAAIPWFLSVPVNLSSLSRDSNITLTFLAFAAVNISPASFILSIMCISFISLFPPVNTSRMTFLPYMNNLFKLLYDECACFGEFQYVAELACLFFQGIRLFILFFCAHFFYLFYQLDRFFRGRLKLRLYFQYPGHFPDIRFQHLQVCFYIAFILIHFLSKYQIFGVVYRFINNTERFCRIKILIQGHCKRRDIRAFFIVQNTFDLRQPLQCIADFSIAFFDRFYIFPGKVNRPAVVRGQVEHPYHFSRKVGNDIPDKNKVPF